jgi:Icc-related predicted phosphoesterase
LKILVVSDAECPHLWERFDSSIVEGVELIISCGDLKPEYLTFLATMLPVPLFYVLGNHDRDTPASAYDGCQSIDGRVVNYKGIRFLGLGGVRSPAPMPLHYTEDKMTHRIYKLRRELRRQGGIDVFVAHSAPAGLGDGADSYHQGFECFRDLIDRYNPKFCFHGHQHLNYAPLSKRVLLYRNTHIVNGFRYYVVDVN